MKFLCISARWPEGKLVYSAKFIHLQLCQRICSAPVAGFRTECSGHPMRHIVWKFSSEDTKHVLKRYRNWEFHKESFAESLKQYLTRNLLKIILRWMLTGICECFSGCSFGGITEEFKKKYSVGLSEPNP